MVKLGCIVLIVVAMAVLVESASSPTTRKPRSRKAPLSRSLSSGGSSSSSSSSSFSSSSSSSSSRRVKPSSSSSRRASSRTSGSVGSSSGSRRSSSSSTSRGSQSSSSSSREQSQVAAAATSVSLAASSNQLPNNATGVRRNPASVQSSFSDFQTSGVVNTGRLREDMKELGLTAESEDDFNNVNVMEGVNSGRQQAGWSASRSNAYSQYSDYEDLLFDEYDQPLQDNKLLAETSSSSSSSGKFLKSEVCGRKFFCQRGNRGPCHRNEVFLPQMNDSNLVITRPSCGNLISYPWNGCLSAGKVGVSATNTATTGSCAIRFPQRPCYGYPPNYRYCSQTKRCYAGSNGWDAGITSSGPCPLNKVFIDIDGINGMCQCRDRNQLLYKGDDRCHRIYAKGPCPRGQWLEPDTNGYGVCRPSPCPADKCDGRHIYWKSQPNAEGGCYKSFTRGPCRRGSYFLVEDYGTRRGRCVSQYGSSFNPINPYTLPARYPMNRNSYDMMYSNSLMSPWSKFGMYPSFGMQDTMDDFEDDYDDLPNLDY